LLQADAKTVQLTPDEASGLKEKRQEAAEAETLHMSPEAAAGLKKARAVTKTALPRVPEAEAPEPEPAPERVLAKAETVSIAPAGETPGGDTTPPPPAAARPPGSGSGSGSLGIGGRFGNYEITGELGRGGMGVVYRARDVDLGREVALKVLGFELGQSERELARFRREASLASQLRHPRIVGVYNFGELEGRAYYTMPIVEGATLKELLKEEGPLGFERAAKLVEELARAIDSAHQQRVVHRDLKPANVAIDPSGGPLVLDFGLAKDLGGPDLTRTGEILGTPCYMAPEQAAGETQALDHRVDVYALGAILYEVLTGQVPYGGQTASEVIRKILYDDPAPPRSLRPDVPYELETIVLAAMRRERFLRYQTAGAMADDLARFRRQEPVVARRPGLATRALRWCLGHKSTTVLAILLLLVVSIGGLRFKSWGNRLKISQQINEARQALENARGAGDAESASESFHEATLLAEAIYREVPNDDGARATLLEALGARAAFAASRGEWELAELLYGRRARLSGAAEDEEAFRRARGLGQVTVKGLRAGETLTFRRWDSAIGAVDSGRTLQASAQLPAVDLRAGSYLARYQRAGNAQPPLRFLVSLGRSQQQVVEVMDPGAAPPGMVFVPATQLVLTPPGGSPGLVATQACWIDAEAVTRGAFRAFLGTLEPARREALVPGGLPPAGPDDALPVTEVSWEAAQAYAASLGKRLPRRAEWVAAAGGADGRRYPWGEQLEVGRANLRRDELGPDLDFAGDISPYGVIGLAGNGDEWVLDEGPQGTKILCGIAGAYRPETGGRVRPYSFAGPKQSFPDTTFRCVRPVAATARPLPFGGAAPRPPRKVPPAAGPPLVLRVAAWPRYADPNFTRRFAERYLARTGVAVVVSQVVTVGSNDEYLPLLAASPPQVDVVAPSCDMAPELIARRLVQPLEVRSEAELLPAFRRPPFLQARGQCFGVAYASGPMWLLTVGRQEPLRRWGQLWDPGLGGRVAIWDDGVWAVSLAALKLGKHRLFDLSDGDLREVEDSLVELLETKCRLWTNPSDVQAWIAAGEIVACDDWGILAWELSRSKTQVFRVVAAEGTTQWIDSWMVAAHVKGRLRRAAQAWIEYAISPENQRDLLREAGYDPTNERTVELLDKASALARVRTIRQRRLATIERWRPVPRRALYLEVWKRAKARAGR
jgi:serine/threonine protein kinase/spermidine/putrescine-binding protein/formylglycine-generating enzyme required for sulfatase activity